MQRLKLIIGVVIMAYLFPYNTKAQTKDTLDFNQPQNLAPIILTGQYNPQSVDKSVFEVQVISRSQIDRLGGSSLSDVLTQTLNLNIIPTAGEGRSGIEQFGFGSDYIKILVDGVPIIGDEGFGNSIDASQINLDDIEQIEIIEGSMGVQYGADAVTGVVNIITKKWVEHKWNITPYIQEETAGNEYRWGNRGKHIQSLKVGHNLSEDWYLEGIYTHSDFRGYRGNRQGKSYYNPEDTDDGLRGYSWLPKLQTNLKGLLNYNNGSHFKAFYKVEYFSEKLRKYANNVHLNPNNATLTFNPTANDYIFRTERLYHHLNATGKIAQQINYNFAVSFQQQNRNVEDYTYRIHTNEKSNIDRYDYNTRKGIFSRGTLNNFFDSKIIDLEAGYELNFDRGTASGLSEQNTTTDLQKNTLKTYSGFISAEIKPIKKLSLKPGYRLLASSKFSNQQAFSLSAKYQFKNNYQLRAVIGSSPKIPTFEELYYLLVDANHDVQGNENLIPEKGKSVFLHFKKPFRWKENQMIYTPKFTVWYLDVKDKIDLIIVNNSPLKYQYENINSFKNWGISWRNTFTYKNWNASLGLSVQGESKLYKAELNANDEYLYNVQFNTNIGYQIPKWNTTISAFLKYNGAQYEYVSTLDDNGDNAVIKAKQDPYSWITASAQKKLLNEQLEITLGVRNLANVKDIKTRSSTPANAGHGTAGTSINMSYGRSYFLKLLYNLNF